MTIILITEITSDNWRETLTLAVRPEQQRFVAEHSPIAALGLAKAYVQPGGLSWIPCAIYADSSMVGYIELAYAEQSTSDFWIFHCFIDQAYQGMGYGKQRSSDLANQSTSKTCHRRHARHAAHSATDVARRSGER